MNDRVNLTLAHSPDPDDVFMWWPLTGMIDPRDRRTITSPPELDTGRFRFTSVPEDIAILNRRATDKGDLDISALSIFAWANEPVRSRYALTSFGSSMGRGYGPKLVVNASPSSARSSSVCYADEVVAANAAARSRLTSTPPHLLTSSLPHPATPSPRHPRFRIAVPGTRTTAFLLLSLILGPDSFEHVEMPFDQITDAVARGDDGINAGLLIHQSQLTFTDLGLEVVLDVGAWWLEHTGLPLPLGGNAIRRDLDQRFGAGATRDVARLLHRSILYALKHRDRSIEYSMRWAPELTRPAAEKYIDMYVNDLTLDAGEQGRSAIERLLDEGARRGLCPAAGRVEFVRPD